MRWTLHYHPTVIHYLISLGDAGSRLRRFIEYLQFDPSLNGWAMHKPKTNYWEICVEEHVVLYELREERQEIAILLVKPYSEL